MNPYSVIILILLWIIYRLWQQTRRVAFGLTELAEHYSMGDESAGLGLSDRDPVTEFYFAVPDIVWVGGTACRSCGV